MFEIFTIIIEFFTCLWSKYFLNNDEKSKFKIFLFKLNNWYKNLVVTKRKQKFHEEVSCNFFTAWMYQIIILNFL